jgi:hypothetical protein
VLDASRRRGRLLQHSYETAQVNEVADSALRLMILELGAPPHGAEREAAQSVRTYEIFGHRVIASFDYEAGRIDLNAANEELLTAVFAATGLEEPAAHSIALRILDWRDADDSPARDGAERQHYRSAQRSAGPRNGPFETPTELREVLNLPALDDEMLDAFTVYSHSSTVREDAAASGVTAALRWLHRNDAPSVTTQTERTELEPRVDGESIRLRACVESRDQKRCRVAIVRFTGNRADPVMIYRWYSA